MKRVFVLILTIGASGGVWPLVAQTEYTTDGTPTGLEEEIRWRVNRGRFDTASENRARATAYTDVSASTGPLAPHQGLTLAARHHSEDMAKKNLFQHATVPGSAYYNATTQPNPWDRMRAEGYSYNYAGENIAAGYSGAEAAYVGWWNSTGHRQNMYNAALREIGNGYYYWGSSTYGRYYTMDLGSYGSTRFLTDTLFHDANGNATYDQGEGVSGVRISLLVAGTAHSSFDISAAVGSFALSIQSIAAGAAVQVVLSNTTSSQVTLSIPRNYQTFTVVTLAARQSRTFGTYTQPAEIRNVGLRDVVPAAPPVVAPPLLLSRSGPDFLLRWLSETNLEYLPQRSTNLLGLERPDHELRGRDRHQHDLERRRAPAGAALVLLPPAGPQPLRRLAKPSRGRAGVECRQDRTTNLADAAKPATLHPQSTSNFQLPIFNLKLPGFRTCRSGRYRSREEIRAPRERRPTRKSPRKRPRRPNSIA